jgi:hypothetical protein
MLAEPSLAHWRIKLNPDSNSWQTGATCNCPAITERNLNHNRLGLTEADICDDLPEQGVTGTRLEIILLFCNACIAHGQFGIRRRSRHQGRNGKEILLF